MKSVLITGCSSGFGLKTAVTLAKNGFRVFATMRDLGKRAALDTALADAGVKAEVLRLDVTDAASIEAAVKTVLAQAGRIDALVNNAGIALAAFAEDLTLEDYRRQLETNFFGVVAVTKAVLPHMRAQRAGRIVNVSSIGGRCGNPLVSAYVASKFAVEGFSESLAYETTLFDVSIVLIEPGAFKTEIFEANRQVAAGARDPNSPYAKVLPVIEAKVNDMVARHADDPQKVADTILHALTVDKPKLRYLVGTEAKLRAGIRGLFGAGIEAAFIGRLFGWSAIIAKFKAGT